MSEIKPTVSKEEWDRTLLATAARCLHGQPFGFTRYDVENVRMMMPLLSLADRIEALLLPEPPAVEPPASSPPKQEVWHVCGASGFGYHPDDFCPACRSSSPAGSKE